MPIDSALHGVPGGGEGAAVVGQRKASFPPVELVAAGHANHGFRRQRTLSIDELIELLASDDAPDVLVAYEFSGALTEQLVYERGEKAISVDRRPTEGAVTHCQADVQDVAVLKVWKVIFFVGPPCFQQLRGDKECLDAKIRDGRAFRAVAEVAWCISCPHAKPVFVEQPDTIAHDYIEVQLIDGVVVVEVRTGLRVRVEG